MKLFKHHKIFFSLLLFSLLNPIVHGQEADKGDPSNKVVKVPVPRPAQLAWQEAEIGALICYEIHPFKDKRYNQRKDRTAPIKDVNIFNPTNLDTDQWIKGVKAMGGKFAILTASHETGFRLWQSDANPYCLKAVKWGNGKRDIVAEFIASCRKYGIKPGIYLGTRWNAQLGVLDFKVTKRSTITQEAYNKMIEAEVKEICTRYGELFEIWFDGGAYGPKDGGPDVLSIVEKHQPNIHFYHNYQRADSRWGGSESGTVPYPCWATMPFADGYEAHRNESHAHGHRLLKQGDPNGAHWCPAMSDYPLRGHGAHLWFWNPGEDKHVMPLQKMMHKYYHSVGHNTTLYIGLTPDTNGLLPKADFQRITEFGNALQTIYSSKVAEVSGKGSSLILDLEGTKEYDHLMIQEDIKQGERVRKFKVEELNAGQWNEVTTGSCIGHKRIIHFPTKRKAEKVRLTVQSSIAEPIIKAMSIYNTAKAPKTKAPKKAE